MGFFAYRPENHHFRLREFAFHLQRRTPFVSDEARKPAINGSGVEVLVLNASLSGNANNVRSPCPKTNSLIVGQLMEIRSLTIWNAGFRGEMQRTPSSR